VLRRGRFRSSWAWVVGDGCKSARVAFQAGQKGFNPRRGISLLVVMLAVLVITHALDKEGYFLSVAFGVLFVGLSDPGGQYAYRAPRVALVRSLLQSAVVSWPAARCRGWPASGPGRLRPGPCLLTGVAALGSGVKSDSAYTVTRHFLPVLVARRSRSRLRREGRTRTLSGSSPDLSPAKTLAVYKIAKGWLRLNLFAPSLTY
jgi:hypothetical protein